MDAVVVRAFKCLQERSHGVRSYAAEFQHADGFGAEVVSAKMERECLGQVLPYTFQTSSREDVVVDNFFMRAADEEQCESCENPGAVFASYIRERSAETPFMTWETKYKGDNRSGRDEYRTRFQEATYQSNGK